MIFLSFDTEEFAVPCGLNSEYDSVRDGMPISIFGINRILDVLNENKIKATFFCTSTFAINAQSTIQRIIDNGHEVASHGCNHYLPKEDDALVSKQILESLTGQQIKGYRQPNMKPINMQALVKAGYIYNASLNPTYIPGRYMNYFKPRKPFIEENIIQIPTSVTPVLRIPLFWWSLHIFPVWFYNFFCKLTHRYDGNINTYFHPWEFYDLYSLEDIKISWMDKYRSGDEFLLRFEKFITVLKKSGFQFGTYSELVENLICK